MEILTTFRWGTKLITLGNWLMEPKLLAVAGSERGDQNPSVLLEQKSVSWIKVLVPELSKGNEEVVD